MFDTIYAVMPKLDARTKAGKEEKQAFEEAHEGKVILTDALFDTAQSCAEAITSSSANALLQNGVAEASFFGQLEGYDAKCRPDYYCRERSLIIDIKKTTDASPEGFTRADANFKYYIQAAWYLDVLKSIGEPVKDFLFIAVEATAPFMVGIYRLADSAIEFGRLKYREALKTYRNINDFAKPIYRDTETRKYIQTIDLPAYVYAQNKNSNLMEVYHG
uniref:PD-(D/E)XK nuclease-like domain-containing protein n=1 Tax=Caedibacter taeniospiralis TaxID=28907 RepID=UPI001867F618|nr:PD-(D/E)XK nuclease-like domain-containing protein [Caedibacter taeniospiralis]